MESRDIDLYLNKILINFNNKNKLACHVILLDIIDNVGLNKKMIINNLKKYIDDEKLVELSNLSFCNKTYLKNFIFLKKNEKEAIIEQVISIIESCDEDNGNLIVEIQPKLKDKQVKTNEINKQFYELVEDCELGNVKFDLENGEVFINVKKYNSETEFNGFPVSFDIGEIVIGDIKYIDLKKDFQKYKDIFLNHIKIIIKNTDKIRESAIEELWNWMKIDFSESNIKNKFLKISMTLAMTVLYEDDEYTTFQILWGFESGNDTEDYSGYMDGTIDKNTKKITFGDIGLW